MKFLADENVDFKLVRWLREIGHDVKIAKKALEILNYLNYQKN